MRSEDLILLMTEFDAGDPKRIQHFIKVYEFAHIIGVTEGLDAETLHILDMASILHDIGIHPAEEKYGDCSGKHQEEEGPDYAETLLREFESVTEEEISRVRYLIGHHHTYEEVDGQDYQILLEADFLVNALEDDLEKEAIIKFRDRVFRTETGIDLLDMMFDL